MSSMLRDTKANTNMDALKSEIRVALINNRANACPIAARLAWHAAGTYDAATGTGGCNGSTMRFEPESSDPDNAGLSIVRDILKPIKAAHPELSNADLWAVAGCVGIEFLGGPKIQVNLGRTDDPDGRRCPMNGRLPDASQGAAHLRKVFGRMGFNDQEIVALSGAHTLGRCHKSRSGFDGPWTVKPLKFDNTYYVNLVSRDWRPRKWDGRDQFEDVQTGTLMMLPTDMALIEDPKFRAYVEQYADDEGLFFRDFAAAFAKLIALGCPESCQPRFRPPPPSSQDRASASFREHCMHGSLDATRALLGKADVHQLEATSGRSAVHKAAFWGHDHMIDFLLKECHINPDIQDCYGGTALHDAARFGHLSTIDRLLANGASTTLKDKDGHTPADVAAMQGYPAIAAKIGTPRSRL